NNQPFSCSLSPHKNSHNSDNSIIESSLSRSHKEVFKTCNDYSINENNGQEENSLDNLDSNNSIIQSPLSCPNKKVLKDCTNYSINANNEQVGSSVASTNFMNSNLLSQILNEFPENDPEEIWIYINSKLEGFFGHDSVLKPKEEELKMDYLKLMFELQNCAILNPFKNLIQHWMSKAEKTFNDNLSSDTLDISLTKINQGLINWKNKHDKLGKDQIEKLKHFVCLKQFYQDLWRLAISEFNNLKETQKNGKDPSKKSLRGWVSDHICNSISISDRQERKIWNSLCLLDALLAHETVTFGSLIEKNHTLNFFIKMKDGERQNFYKDFTNEKKDYKPFLQKDDDPDDNTIFYQILKLRNYQQYRKSISAPNENAKIFVDHFYIDYVNQSDHLKQLYVLCM
ncbi:11926_t:CDS:2, partial [Gigaspora margarita]